MTRGSEKIANNEGASASHSGRNSRRSVRNVRLLKEGISMRSATDVAGQKRMLPIQAPVPAGQLGQRSMIVGDGQQRHDPSVLRLLDDGIARIRRSGLDHVRRRVNVVVCGETHASRIDADLTTTCTDTARNVRMAAGDERRALGPEA